MSADQKLLERLRERLNEDEAEAVLRALGQAADVATLVELFDELADASERVCSDAVQALGALHRRAGLALVVPWLDLGVAITRTSGAAGLRYVRESPPLLEGLGSGPEAARVLQVALELAESDANVALEFVRKADALRRVVPLEELERWADIGLDLAGVDYVLSVEFLRQGPNLAAVLPLEHVRAWVGFGMKLVTQNSLGKTDYFATLEFFRTSPNILGDIEHGSLRGLVVTLGDQLAQQDPQGAVEFLAEAPTLLRRLPSEEWSRRVLQYGGLLAERDPGATLAYVRRCPELLALLGGLRADLSKFEDWFRSGMEVLEYSVEGGRAYFAVETRKALASVEQALNGVPLRQVSRSLKLFVEGLCGIPVTIQGIPEPDRPESEAPPRPTVSADGRTIALPSIVRRHQTRDENIRLYTVMAAHEAGHLEFGTYDLSLARLDDLASEVSRRYPSPEAAAPAIQTLSDLFARYPQPALMRDLWTVLEDARVEYLLRSAYPGLREDLAAQASDAATPRSITHGLSVREMLVDHLLLMTTRGSAETPVPEVLRETVDAAWDVARNVLQPSATAEDAVRRADRIYALLEASLTQRQGPESTTDEAGPATGGPAASDATTGDYQPVSNWSYRGVMDPERIRRAGEAPEQDGAQGDRESAESGPRAGASGLTGGRRPGDAPQSSVEAVEQEPADLPEGPTAPTSLAEEVLQLPDARRGEALRDEGYPDSLVYDEWDGTIQDYRSGWCRVLERPVEEGEPDFAEGVLARHGSMVALLRRYFETIRPEGLRRLYGRADGDEVDLDAAIRRRVDQRAGAEPVDRIYVRRERRERDVAVAFLVDVSGSTSRVIGADSRRVIDVEKEGLVVLTQALEATGDQYAIYGYSGRGRRRVEFLVFKDFEETGPGRAMNRIGTAAPRHQNRDGAAIRHATRKLMARQAKVRLLILINDGKPLDDGYADEYSLEDTRMALREARMRGVEPFCITVDREADDYLRRLYGEVRYLIIDNIASLPERLPRIYQRLTT